MPDYDYFKQLADESLLVRIERKEEFHQQAVMAAFFILKERGYHIDPPFGEELPFLSPVETPDKQPAPQEEAHLAFKTTHHKIPLIKLFGYFSVFAVFLYFSNYYLTETLLYRKIYVFTETLLGFGSTSYLLQLSIFSVFFMFSSRTRKELSRDTTRDAYIAIKVFLFSLLVLTFWEFLIRDEVLFQTIYYQSSYRTFIQGLWYDLLIAFSEELVFKWLLLTQILVRIGNSKQNRIGAYLVVALLFAISHIPIQLEKQETINYGHLLMTFLYSYLTSILYVRHRNFLLVVLLHFLADTSVAFTDINNSFFFNCSLILIGIYTIPRVGRSWLFQPVFQQLKNPAGALLGVLCLATAIAPFTKMSSQDYYNISQQQYYHFETDAEALKTAHASLHNSSENASADNKLYYNHRGNVFFDLEQYDSAWADYNQAAILDPSFYPAIRNRGLAAKELSNYEDCIHDLTLAIEHQLGDSRVFQSRGSCYLDTKQYELAKEDFRKVLTLEPQHKLATFGLGRTFLMLQMFDSAIHYMDQVITIDPGYTQALEVKAIAYTGLSKFDTSNLIMTRAIELGASGSIRFFIRGLNYYHKEEYHNAIKEFEKSLELLPNDAELRQYLAYSYLFLGNTAKGCQYLTLAARHGSVSASEDLKVYCQ